jgi:autotransporter passenger strand-loop-strand repeat protein
LDNIDDPKSAREGIPARSTPVTLVLEERGSNDLGVSVTKGASMTTFTAPPNKSHLMLNDGDILNVNSGGVAKDTTINNGGVENVNKGGDAMLTTINRGGVENVFAGGTAVETIINKGGVENVNGSGVAFDTTINNGGVENVNDGMAFDTIINKGGVENVNGGVTLDTMINNGGVENVLSGGTAFDVAFSGPHATLNLATPLGLKGFVANWHVGDVIDFLKTDVTSVQQTGNRLTVTYDDNKTATYELSHQQHHTEFQLQPDGHGGTNLILVHAGGVQQHEAASQIHFGPGPGVTDLVPIVGVGHAHHEVAGHLV